MLVNLALLFGTFLFMEFMSWFTHKFIMHGFLWHLHQDHHVKGEGTFFEKNDTFFLIFAIPSFFLILFGSLNGFDYRAWIGFGILMYGIAYFLVHDVFIHQRFKWLRNTESTYFRAIRKAHKVHHKKMDKEDGECFGMLVVPYKYLKEALKSKN